MIGPGWQGFLTGMQRDYDVKLGGVRVPTLNHPNGMGACDGLLTWGGDVEGEEFLLAATGW